MIYSDKLKIKNTTDTESGISDSYLESLLNIGSNDRLKTTLYDKRDGFNLAIVNFPYVCSNMPLSSAYDVYIFQLIRYA
jgi:hypothetical protein